MEVTKEQMAANIEKIRQRIEKAALSSGRDPKNVRLCAVCKTRTVQEVMASAGLDIDLFGENREQELREKLSAGAYLQKPCHFIGHLQTNKVNKVVGKVAMIESVGSLHLLEKIEEASRRLDIVQDILLEINIGMEASKSGISPTELWPLAERAENSPYLRLRGLMAIPPAGAQPDETRAFFARMRELFLSLGEKGYKNTDTLSMGMSGDFELAVMEGATIVRLGTAIYGPRNYGPAESKQ